MNKTSIIFILFGSSLGCPAGRNYQPEIPITTEPDYVNPNYEIPTYQTQSKTTTTVQTTPSTTTEKPGSS